MRFLPLLLPTVTFLLASSLAQAATLEVGGGKKYARLEDALAQAKGGDEIAVYAPQEKGGYDKTALLVRTPKLTIRNADKVEIALNGGGYEYSGKGQTSRAIVQFDPGSDGSALEGFTLTNARNSSFNGAGVRINQANDITIRNCRITGNDMGIMSNGDAGKGTAARQLIEACTLTKNGTEKDPGYNHNLYLGGTSVVIRGCEISHSVTGHNVKSRAHLTWVEYSYIHDSANRELDLVDAKGNTDREGAHAVLLGNFIRKAPKMSGNKTVIHFGQDGKADHTGTLFLVHNTILTLYMSPVLDLSAPGTSAVFLNNLIDDLGAKQKGVIVNARDGAKRDAVTGEGNWLAQAFLENCPALLKTGKIVDWKSLPLPWASKTQKAAPLLEYRGVGQLKERKEPADAGAGTLPK